MTKMAPPNHHYVLTTPLHPPFDSKFERAVFATGCFWGSEKGFWRLPGVHSTAVGYAGGHTPNPSYDAVCSGCTGHAEAVQVVYDPDKCSFSDLLKQFWESHDPTQGSRQGGDHGTQYRSAIFCYSSDHFVLAIQSKKAFEKVIGKKITTEIIMLEHEIQFYYAEDYHQQYLAKPGNRQYCSASPLGRTLPEYHTWAPSSLLKSCYGPKLSAEFWKKYPVGHVLAVSNEQIVWEY